MKSGSKISKMEVLSCAAGWRNYYFVKLTTDDGLIGWSEFDEAFGSPGVSDAIRQLSSCVVGRSVMNHERIYAELRCITRPAFGGVIGQALGAIENAILDAKAKRLGIPCYELLGGMIRSKLRVYWSHCVTHRAGRAPHYQPAIRDAEGVLAIGREVRERGFTALKTNIWWYDAGAIRGWAPGFGRPFLPELNVDRKVLKGLRHHVEILRESVGPDVDILLDLNFNAKTEGYLQILRALGEMRLLWVEIDSLDPRALAWIRSQSAHPIASCETLIGLQQYLPFLRESAVDVAIVDAPWNGVWQSMKIAAAAETREVNVACHNFYGHLCTMMNAHFCASVPNLRIMEVDVDRISFDQELFTHTPVFEQGHLVVPDRPGWGTEPVEEALRAHPPLSLHGYIHAARTQTRA